jgi:hypothetical protein
MLGAAFMAGILQPSARRRESPEMRPIPLLVFIGSDGRFLYPDGGEAWEAWAARYPTTGIVTVKVAPWCGRLSIAGVPWTSGCVLCYFQSGTGGRGCRASRDAHGIRHFQAENSIEALEPDPRLIYLGMPDDVLERFRAHAENAPTDRGRQVIQAAFGLDRG